MLYFVYGKNTKKALDKAQAILAILKNKKPQAELIKLDTDNFSVDALEELVGSQGLFERKIIVFLSRITERKENKELFLERLGGVASSDNAFVMLEESVDKVMLAKITASAERVEEVPELKTTKTQKFNLFALTDAFGLRNKKELWVLYRKALKSEVSLEELSGILFWQVKNILLAQTSPSAESAGLNPFVFSKARNFARNYKREELEKISLKMTSLYHNSHRGVVDFEFGLERVILEI